MTTTSGENDVVIGQKLGDFIVEERVAHGGMGIVYRAVQPMIGRRVAVKVLRPEMATDRAQVDRFLAEARAISAIRHRGIVDVFSFGVLPDGRQYMVMEFLEGEALDAVISREGPLPYALALPIFDEILDALSAAHGANIIHRDLKPSNVFIAGQTNGTKVVKLVDFGLAKQTPLGDVSTREGERASLIGGTPEYVSPEQIRGEVPVAQTDLYGLGVVMFETLCARLPFDGPTVVHTLEMHAKQQPPHVRAFRGDVPPGLDDLICRMMAKRIAERPASAQAARQEIHRLMRDLQIDGASQPRELPTTPSFPELPASGRRPSPLRWVLGGAALLVATLGAAYLGRSTREAEAPPPAPLMTPAPPPPVVQQVKAEAVVATPEAVEAVEKTDKPDKPERAARRKYAEWDALPGREWLAKVSAQLDRNEAKLKKQAPPGEDPSRNAVNLLSVLRGKVQAAAKEGKKERVSATMSVIGWERQFLK